MYLVTHPSIESNTNPTKLFFAKNVNLVFVNGEN